MRLFLHKNINNALRSLELVHDTQPGLVRKSIGLSYLLHPGITAVSHSHKIANVNVVSEVVSDVADSIHDAEKTLPSSGTGGAPCPAAHGRDGWAGPGEALHTLVREDAGETHHCEQKWGLLSPQKSNTSPEV